jgi:hypothetical protein
MYASNLVKFIVGICIEYSQFHLRVGYSLLHPLQMLARLGRSGAGVLKVETKQGKSKYLNSTGSR